MELITSIKCDSGIKYIVGRSGTNYEITKLSKIKDYGDCKGLINYTFRKIDVYQNLMLGINSSVHLAELVLAVELVRFVIEKTKQKEVA